MILNFAKGETSTKGYRGKRTDKTSFNIPLGQHVSFYFLNSRLQNRDIVISFGDTQPIVICPANEEYKGFKIQVTQFPDKDISIHIWHCRYSNRSSGIENKLCYKVELDPSTVANDDSTFIFSLSSENEEEVDGYTYISNIVYK